MADLKPLVSTVDPKESTVAALEAAVAAAEGNPSQLASGVQPSLKDLLAQLATDGIIKEGSQLAQLAASSSDFQSFTQSILDAIFQAKEATPQGLLLAQQLKDGTIDQAKFVAAINDISIPIINLQASLANTVNAAVQKLLLALASNNNLEKLSKLTSKATIVPTDTINGILSTTNDKNPSPQAKLSSKFSDEKLGFFDNLFAQAKAIALQNLKASANSLLSLKMQPKVMSGARAIIKVNGNVAALCTNVSYEINTDWTEIRGVDELLPNDLAPQAYSVKGSFTLYRIPNGSPVTSFIQQDMFRGIIWPLSSLEIRDARTDESICLIKRMAITGRSESFVKGQLTGSQFSFVGIGFRDEETPQLLPDKLSGQDQDDSGLLNDLANLVPDSIKNLF